MILFHFDIRNSSALLADKKGRYCANVLEAMTLAKAALETLDAESVTAGAPWIEIADEQRKPVATVRLDEVRN
jgi:hypothetical protein